MLRGSKVSETVSQVLQWVSLGRRSLNPDQEQEPSTAPLRRLGVGADRGSPRPKSKRGSAPAPPPELSTGQPLSPSPLLEPCSLDLRLATCYSLLSRLSTLCSLALQVQTPSPPRCFSSRDTRCHLQPWPWLLPWPCWSDLQLLVSEGLRA